MRLANMNFAEICRANVPQLEKSFEEAIRAADTGTASTLMRFAERIVREGCVGINMRPMVLLDFLNRDYLLNIHEWAERVSARAGKPSVEVLREKLGPYFERRMAFDRHFDRGLEFRYGALNIGGLGAKRFGEYCLVFNHGRIAARCTVGWLKGDSLNHYMTDEPTVDEAKLCADCASDDRKHMLATLKHASELVARRPDDWPRMVCREDCYIEAIVEGSLKPDSLGCVRIGKLDFDLYWEYAFIEFTGKLSELDRYRVDAFAAIDERLQAAGVSWETVEDA
jgi:hypothetical protein